MLHVYMYACTQHRENHHYSNTQHSLIACTKSTVNDHYVPQNNYASVRMRKRGMFVCVSVSVCLSVYREVCLCVCECVYSV